MDKAQRSKSLSPTDSDLKLNEDRLFYVYGKSPRSNNSSSAEEGAGSSSSFDTSSAGSTCSSDIQGGPARKNFTRTNHSEIEKRRRRKINKFIDELSELIPTCSNAGRKPDKLTVLKMAVQHIRILGHRNEKRSTTSETCKPFFLTDEELGSLLEEASGGFLFATNPERFQVLHVSDTVQQYLALSPMELIGKRLLDVVHPKDVPIIREELSHTQSRSFSPSTRLVCSSSDESSSSSNTFVMTCRRAFFCRFRNKRSPEQEMPNAGASSADAPMQDNTFQAEADANDYSIIHCIGYLKSWHPTNAPLFTMDTELAMTSSSCFFAIGKKVDVLAERKNLGAEELENLRLEFSCRFAADGRYLHVDPRIVSILGHLPQDLLSQKFYDLIAAEDKQNVQIFIEALLNSKTSELVIMDTYHMVSRIGLYMPVVTALHCFYNPVTSELEYIIQQSSLIL